MTADEVKRLDAEAYLREKSGFLYVLSESLQTAGMVENFNRLYGCKLGLRSPKTPIDAAVDKATGYDKVREVEDLADMKKFAEFVRRCIWDTLPLSVRAEISAGVERVLQAG